MLLVLVLVLQIVVVWAGARSLRQKRIHWSTSRIATTAALPVPLLAAALFAYIAGYDRLVEPVDEVRFDGAITLIIGTVVLVLIGVVVAAVAARKNAGSEDLTDIFE